MIKNPNRDIGGQTFILKFSLSKNSKGLKYNQIIAIDFPNYPLLNEIFKNFYAKSEENSFSCELTDSKNLINSTNNSYKIEALKTNKILNNNIAACKFLDFEKNLEAGKSYKLTIKFSKKILFKKYPKISCLNLFTATSIEKGKVLIDSNPCFGDIALYKNWLDLKINIPLLAIENIKFDKNPVLINSKVDINMHLKVTKDFYFDGKLLEIKFPKAFSFPESVESLAENNLTKLQGDLSLMKNLENNNFFLMGIQSEKKIEKNTLLNIIFKGINVGDSFLVNEKIEALLYYKNSYSVISYSFFSNINTNPYSIKDLSVNHPENLNVYKKTVSPLKFEFSLPFTSEESNLLEKGEKYVVIKHENISNSKIKVNFISSTCDFSETKIFSQILGQRPICFDLRNELDFSLKVSDPDDKPQGSAIVFKLPDLKKFSKEKNLKIILTVFAYNDQCGSSDKITEESKTKFSFSAKIYKKIDMKKFGEKRFEENDIIAKTDNNISMSHFCFGNSGLGLIKKEDYAVDNKIIFTEINDFRFLMNSNSNPAKINSPLKKINYADISKLSKAYISDEENQMLINESYLSLVIKIKQNTKFYELISIPSKASNDYNSYLSGYTKIFFSQNFLETGDQKCYFSWSAVGPTSPSQDQLLIDLENSGDFKQKNFMDSDSNSSQNWDNGNSKLQTSGPEKSLPLRIISKIENGSKFKFLSDAYESQKDANTFGYLLLYTNCLKFKKTFNYKSIYNYFEMQINFFDSNDFENSLRINRIFKFMGSDGILEENKHFKANVIFHGFNYSTNTRNEENLKFYNNAICMVEIKSADLKTSYNKNSNKLIVNIFNMLLLDIDYAEISSTYPNNNNLLAYHNPAFPVTKGMVDNTSKPLTDPWTITNTINSSEYENYTYGSNSDFPYSQLGSNIIFDINSTNINNLKDLLIPVMCPVMRKTHNPAKPIYMPYISLSWAYFENDSYNSVKINSVLQPQGKPTNFFELSDYYISSKNNNQNTNFPVPTSIKFNPMTYKDDDKLFILPAAPTKDNPNGFTFSNSNNCSVFSLLINEKIQTINDNPSLKLFKSSKASFYEGSYSEGQIYFYGFPFKKMLFANIDQEFTMRAYTKTSKLNDAIYFKGIRRPLINDFYDEKNNTYNFLNLLAFQCTSKKKDTSGANYFSNYNFFEILNSENLRSTSFILDINTDTNTIWSTTTVSSDKPSDIVYKNDLGGNMRISLKSPNNLDISKSISFNLQSYVFTQSTICGINNNKIPSETYPCNTYFDQNENKYFSNCNNPNKMQDFIICCYNINIEADKILFPTINLIYNYDSSVKNYNNYVFNSNAKIIPLPGSDFETGYSNGQDLLGATQTGNKFTNIQYDLTIGGQNKAIGKANILVKLAREIPRGSILVANGDFSKLSISKKLKPKCSVNIKGLEDFVESCDIDLPIGDVITIKFKNDILNCGNSIPKELTISIYPVFVHKYERATSPNYSIKLYTDYYKLLVNSSGLEKLNYSGASIDSTKNLVIFQKKFFKIETFPFIPGEVADYILTFDLQKNEKELKLEKYLNFNEALIYFPFEIFYSKLTILEKPVCKFRQNSNENSALSVFSNVECSLIEDNLLSVKFPSEFDKNKNLGNIQIQIISIPNRFSNDNLSFSCSLNNLSTAGKRIQIINGTGKFYKKLVELNDAKIGALDLFDISTNSPIPSDLSTLSLKLRYDNFLNTANKLIFPKDTYFIIYFPKEYNTNFLKISKDLKINLIEVSYDSKGNFVNKSYPLKSQEFNGQRLIIKISDEIKLTELFSYWEINIINIINPLFPINTTGKFKIIITNSFSEFIYKTYTNTGSIGLNNLENPIDSYLRFTKGLKYYFANKKWQLEIYSKDKIIKQKIFLKKGRFVKYVIRTNISNQKDLDLKHSKTFISLKDDLIKTNLSQYELITAKGSVEFYIGIDCAAKLSENYYINFENSNTKDFFNINQFLVSLDESLGVISIPTPIIDSIKQGKQLVNFSLSEPTFSPFDLTFTQGEGAKNDETASLEKIGFLPMSSNKISTFKITSLTAKGFQIFKINNPNTCYKLLYPTVTINVNTENNEFPKGYYLSNFLTFSNSDSDSSIKKNSLKIKFTSTIAPIFLYCALVCFDKNYPKNIDLINKGPNYDNTSPFEKFDSMFIPVSFGTFSFTFDNLIRGMQYKLKCIAKNTNAESSKFYTASLDKITKYRKRIFIDKDIFFNSNFKYEINSGGHYKLYDRDQVFPTSNLVEFQKFDTEIKVSENTSTHCLKFGIGNKISEENKYKLLNFCQRHFINYLGCTICIDSDSKTIEGLELSKNVTCVGTEENKSNTTDNTPRNKNEKNSSNDNNNNNKKNRILQEINSTKKAQEYSYWDYFFNNNSNKKQAGDYYTICAVQDLKCDNNIEYPIKYNQIILNMIKSLKDENSIKKNLNSTDFAYDTLSIIYDKIPLDISRMRDMITDTYKNETEYKITILPTFNKGIDNVVYETQLKCYWKINKKSLPPLYIEIQNCFDKKICGSVQVDSKEFSISFKYEKIKDSNDPNIGTYNIWTVCFTDVPNPSKPSAVLSLREFKITPPNKGLRILDDTNYEGNYNIENDFKILGKNFTENFIERDDNYNNNNNDYGNDKYSEYEEVEVVNNVRKFRNLESENEN